MKLPQNNNGRTSSANFDRNQLKHNVLMNSCYSKGKTLVIITNVHHHCNRCIIIIISSSASSSRLKCFCDFQVHQTISERAFVIREQKPLISDGDLIKWSPWLELFSFVIGIVRRLQSQRLPHKCWQEPSKNVTLLPQHLPPSHFSLVSATCYKSCPRLPILANISLFLKKVTDTLLLSTTSD